MPHTKCFVHFPKKNPTENHLHFQQNGAGGCAPPLYGNACNSTDLVCKICINAHNLGHSHQLFRNYCTLMYILGHMPNVILMAPLQNLVFLKLLQNQNCNSLH